MPAPNRTMYAVLGFLSRRPMSGYDLKKAIEQSVGNFWKESYGQLYPILGRLSDEGLAKRVESKGAGKRARHVYSITPAGRQALRRWLEDSTDPQPVRNELLLKLFFGRRGDPGWSKREVERTRRRLAADLERYEKIHERLSREHSSDPDYEYWLITLRYGERDTRAQLDWCDETLAVLDRMTSRTAAKAQHG
jgi:PadR family transcriptional regulator, regulatory protein AphA